MIEWQSIPPTFQEWVDGDNDGYWWIRYQICPYTEEVDEDTGEKYCWDAVWYNEVVMITHSIERPSTMDDILNGNGRLHARGIGPIGSFYLDDSETTDGLLWQPVVAPTKSK